MHTVNSCFCGCCSLRKASLIIATFNLIGIVISTIYYISYFQPFMLIFSLLGMIMVISGLYGILKMKQRFVIPLLVYQMAMVVVAVFFAFLLIILGANLFIDVLKFLRMNPDKKNIDISPGDVIGTILSCVIAACFQYYWFVVLYSYYKRIVEYEIFD